MRKLLLLLLPVMVAFSSCDDHGKKITVGKSEVYYKGEGVTQQDAEKAGNFLVENKIITKEQESSAQVTKSDNTYLVHLVMDTAGMDPAVKLNMWKLQADLSKNVFNGADARFAFADDRLKDKEVLGPVAVAKEGNTSITFDSGDFTKKSMESFAQMLLAKGMLTPDKEADILVRKENNVPVVRVIVVEDNIKGNEEAMLPVFGYWQHLTQANVPVLQQSTFWLTTTQYKDYKKVPKLSDDVIASFDAELADAQTASAAGTGEEPAGDAGTQPQQEQ